MFALIFQSLAVRCAIFLFGDGGGGVGGGGVGESQ